ncbi:MAG: hypothetical protein ABJB47_00150 [Actinomycetota bacterium]
MPGSGPSFADGAGPDLRNYRVDFAKLNDTFPGLDLRWTVRDGVAEMAAAYASRGLDYDGFTSSRFVRLRRINELLEGGRIDQMMRRLTPGRSPRRALPGPASRADGTGPGGTGRAAAPLPGRQLSQRETDIGSRQPRRHADHHVGHRHPLRP